MEIVLEQGLTKEDLLRRKRELPPYQQTYLTPLGDLPRFVRVLLSNFEVQAAVVMLELVVFEPTTLLALLNSNGHDLPFLWRGTLSVSDEHSARSLLESTFADWVDFLALFDDQRIAIYADHDEFTTLFCLSEADMAAAQNAMSEFGYKSVADWRREFP